MKKVFTAMGMAACLLSQAQNVGINGTGAAPHASAMLDVASTNRGLLIPRVTEAQRNAIASPAISLLVYQTDGTAGFYFYNGNSWQVLGAGDNLGNHFADQNIALTGNYISRVGASDVGLGFNVANGLVYRASNSNFQIGDRLRVDRDGGLVAIGEVSVGATPVIGAGTRMMWHPSKAAFRAGTIEAAQWNESNVGLYSVAMGYNPTASGTSSVALGDGPTAAALASTALGSMAVASGTASFSVGASTAANGFTSIAMGYFSRATSQGGIAIGYRTGATSTYSVAMGYRAVSQHNGSIVFSDASTTDSTMSIANNQFMARYAGGYRLFTNATRTLGVSLAAGGSSWATISDSSRKENFVPASHEAFLANLPRLRLGSWNYKGQSAQDYRHYGPMAQEIFAAYGKDAYGTIGNDTTLAGADMDGLIMILLQGLEKRTAELQRSNHQLQSQLAAVLQQNEALQAKLSQLNRLQGKLAAVMALLPAEEVVDAGVLKQP